MAEAEQVRIEPSPKRTHSRSIVWHLPRPLLSRWLARPEAVGSSLISGETPYGALLHSHLVALWHAVPSLSDLEREAALNAAGVLIAGGIGANADATEPLERARRDSRVVAIKRYVRDHLASDGLEIETLAARFGMSRATLCRLFEPQGGFAHYVQRCRLERAFAALTSNARPRARVLDVALEYQFGSESSFIRAFRSRFGVTPGDLRKLSAAPRLPDVKRRSELGCEVHGWLETLSAPPRQLVT